MGTIRMFNTWRFLFIFFIKWQRWCKVLCLINCNHDFFFFLNFLMERPYYTFKVLSVYLNFITKYSINLVSTLVLLINLHTDSRTLTFVNTNGRPNMLTSAVLNEKFIQSEKSCFINDKKIHKYISLYIMKKVI